MRGAPERRTMRRSRIGGRSLVGALAVLALAVAPVLVTATPAQAATASVSLTSAAPTAESNVPVTFTLSVTCNGPGTCDGAQISFPANAVTGNGTRTDLSTWIGNSSCSGVTRTVSGGQVIFTYATLSPGTQNCNFPVRAPEYTTLNGAVATLTPTVSGPGLPASTGNPVQLTLIAGHNVSMAASATARVLPGGTVTYSMVLSCGANREFTGDIGLSALEMTATLPPNFVFAGYSSGVALPGAFTTPAVGAAGGVLTYSDPTGASCGTPPLSPSSNAIVITITGTIDGGIGATACLSAGSTFTYIDRTTPDTAPASTSPCATVVDLQTVFAKGSLVRTLGNSGQYLFNGATYPYTFPGDWDQSGESLHFDLRFSTSPASVNAGLSYLVRDPLPCLDNLVANVYLSNAPGVLCANPAFLPNKIVAFNFTPTTSDVIRLHHADGTTTDVPYSGTAAGGWPLPTTGSPIAEVEFPAFASQGTNSGGVLQFRITGFASPAVQPDRLMRNIATSQPYLSGTTDTVGAVQTASANVLVADAVAGAGESGSTVIRPYLNTNAVAATCTATVALRGTTTGRFTYVEITRALSDAIYVDYLAPLGATVTTTTTINFAIGGVSNGRNYTSGPIAATSVPDHDGTGRTLYRWTIPAGVVAVPGLYSLAGWNLGLSLGAGCAGTYENDVTVGYGAPLERCVFTNFVTGYAQEAPLFPTANPDLRTNGSPLAGNYCGYSSRINFAAINPGFSIDKTVQGSLDAAPAPSGTNGIVGASGGEASYAVTFTNSGESNLDDPVIYDLLPRVGDTEATSTTSRNSQFAVQLLSMGTLPAGVTVQYSTAANPCRPEVLATNPGCVTDWSATAPAPLSSATALRFAYAGTLAVSGGGTSSFTVTFEATTPAITAGLVAWNSVGGNAEAGGDAVGAAESTYVGLEADGQPAIVKAAGAPTYDTSGGTVSFTYTVTNEASVPVTDVTVVDQFTDAAAGSMPGAVTCTALSAPADTCSGASTDLLAGQTAVFVMTYTIRQADLDHGQIIDQATVTASPDRGPALSNTSNEVTVTAVQDPALTLLKSVAPTVVDGAGDVVAYSFLVTNTGNVTLSSLGITETAFGGTGTTPVATCPSGALAPDAFVTCTASYTVTQGDMDAGSVANTAVASAEFDGAGVLSPASSASVDIDQQPSLDLVKSALPATIGSAGQSITYSFLVTNDGNVTMDAIDVQETAFSGTDTLDPVVCPATELEPGDDMTCSTTYVATQDDIDSGAIDNTATATGNDPAGAALAVPPTSTFSVTVIFAPALTLLKTADVTEVDRVGDVIQYEFLVVNNGNTTLRGLTVDELAFTGAGTLGAIDCPVTTLAPTDQTTCTADYTVVAGDAGAPRISNTAEALATYALGGATLSVVSTDSTAVVAVDPGVTPGLAATGSTVPRWLVALGAAALLAGAALVVFSRRRRPGGLSN